VVDETLAIPSGESVDVDLWRHLFTGDYVVAHLLRDAATGAVLSGGVYPFAVSPPLKTDIHYYYLTSQRIYALTLVPSDPGIASLRYEVASAGGGEAVAEAEATDLQPGARVKTAISAADWPAGDYTLTVEALGGDGQVMQSNSMQFRKPETPEWFESDAGRQIAVSYPWTPVEAEDSAVEVWGRRYEFGDGPLPARIVSQGEDILTGPARMPVSVGGAEAQWTGDGPSLESAGEAEAVFRTLSNASGLMMDARTAVEFDGMMRADLTLSAEEPVTVDRLFVELPVRHEVAAMFSREALGLMAPNERPAEWSELPFAGWIADEAVTLPFTPSIVLRNDDLGLEWFAEWDLGWANADRARRIEVVPGVDEVLLRVRLIDTPTEIAGERTITFGVQAWPAKPWPEQEPHPSNYLLSEARNTENWSFREQLERAIDLGMTTYWWFHWNSFTTETGAKHPPEYPMLPEGEKREEVIEAARITQELGIPIIGHCGYALPPTTPVFEYYGREMAVHPLENKGQWGYKFTADSPFPDAWVHGFKELAEQYGWSGVQLDGAFLPRYNEAPETGSAVRGPDGRLHGKYPIFAYRDFARRLYNVYHGEVDFPGIEHGFVHTHLGAHAIGPIHVFSDAFHSGESTRTMRVRHLSEIDLDLERAVYASGALGVPRTWLLKGGKAPHGPQGRIAIALQLDMIPDHNRILNWADRNNYQPNSYPAHRVWAAREWVGATPETFVWYDESERYATFIGDDAYLSMHLRPGEKALLALSNWTADEREVPITLNLGELGFAGATLQAEDAITGEPVAIHGDAMALQVRGDNYRLIKVFTGEAE
ncbi:MAG: glycoside hydrolase domain-containing protein, partial [Armatimonadota bacterium]